MVVMRVGSQVLRGLKLVPLQAAEVSGAQAGACLEGSREVASSSITTLRGDFLDPQPWVAEEQNGLCQAELSKAAPKRGAGLPPEKMLEMPAAETELTG